MAITILGVESIGEEKELTQPAYTILEAAAVLRVSRATIYRMIEDNQLRTVKIRGRRVVPGSAIEEVLAAAA